jgi:hypothetical protein
MSRVPDTQKVVYLIELIIKIFFVKKEIRELTPFFKDSPQTQKIGCAKKEAVSFICIVFFLALHDFSSQQQTFQHHFFYASKAISMIHLL